MLDSFLSFIPAAGGLGGLTDKLRSDWVGPAFIIVVIVLVIAFMWRRQWMGLITFLAFAVVVGIVIFRTDTFFGQSGSLTDTGSDFGQQAFNSIGAIFAHVGSAASALAPAVGSALGIH